MRKCLFNPLEVKQGMVFQTSETQGLEVSGLNKVLEFAERPEISRKVEAVFNNYDYFDDCHDTLSWSINVTACEQLAVNIVGLKDFLFTAVEDALIMVQEAESLKAQFTTCSTESIFKQIKCYTSVISSAKALVKEAKEDEEDFTENGEAIVQQIDVNLRNCFAKGLTSEVFETKMLQCKLKIKVKGN